MSDILPPLADMLAEFDSGKVPRSKTWHLLISGLYLNNDKVNEIENWYNTVSQLTSVNQELADTISANHNQIEIWYGQVNIWQQQVELNTASSAQSATTATNQATLAKDWAAKPVNELVEANQYSSLHYAQQSSDYADAASTSADKTRIDSLAAAESMRSAASSESNAALSETQSQQYAASALQSKEASAASEKNASDSKDACKISETASANSSASALDSKNLAASSASTATQQANLSTNEANRAKQEADRAKAEANSITIREAPLDGKQYVRQNGKWIEVETDNEWRPGDIKMFAGSINQIQSGWQLCNGVGTTSNGIRVPDLRNRMVIGSGSSYSTGNTGGSTSAATSTNGNHSHSMSVNNTTLSVAQIPSHNHQMRHSYLNPGTSGPRMADNNSNSNVVPSGSMDNTGGSLSHNHSVSSGSAGNHSHTVSTMPPYYALAFIIKL